MSGALPAWICRSMLLKKSVYGSTLRVTVAPGFAFSNCLIAYLKPISSDVLAHVAKVRFPLTLPIFACLPAPLVPFPAGLLVGLLPVPEWTLLQAPSPSRAAAPSEPPRNPRRETDMWVLRDRPALLAGLR